MASVVAVCGLRGAGRIALKQPAMLTTGFTRSYWNKDFKPGPYPRTPEERAAAAKKYGMLPEDYEPYPDDGFGHGDYPKLPEVSHVARDPFHNWDLPDGKRNFGEPIQVNDDAYTEDRYDVGVRTYISYNKMAVILLCVLAGFCGLFTLGEMYPMEMKALPKSFPKPGVTHYTFEPANDSKG